MDVRVGLQLRYDCAHGGMLHLFSKQSVMPPCDHFVLDSNEVIFIDYTGNDFVYLIFLFVVLTFIRPPQSQHALIMLSALLSAVSVISSVDTFRGQLYSLCFGNTDVINRSVIQCQIVADTEIDAAALTGRGGLFRLRICRDVKIEP